MLAEGFCDLGGGVILAKVFMTGGRQPMLFSCFTWSFASQLMKITENISHGIRVVLDTDCGVDLSAVLVNRPPVLTVGGFRQPLLGTCAFTVAELRGPPR